MKFRINETFKFHDYKDNFNMGDYNGFIKPGKVYSVFGPAVNV
jgi:hypothetical protein